MFRCGVTGNLTAPKTPCKKVIVETRPVTYVNRIYNPVTGTFDLKESKGWEIVKEMDVSPEGLEILELKAKGVQ